MAGSNDQKKKQAWLYKQKNRKESKVNYDRLKTKSTNWRIPIILKNSGEGVQPKLYVIFF